MLKKIAGVSFAIAFIMAIAVFGGYGREYISVSSAKTIFLIAGAIGLFLNLLSFTKSENSLIFNFLYWTGSIILFTGLVFMMLRLPFYLYIIMAGMGILGVSFIVPEKTLSAKKNKDILDDLD